MFRQWAVVVFAADPAAGVSAGVVAVVGGVDGLRRARDYSEERHIRRKQTFHRYLPLGGILRTRQRAAGQPFS